MQINPDFAPSPEFIMIANRYRILEKVGEGGLGTVYLALDTQSTPPTQVAVKILHPENLQDPAMLEQIKQEAKTQKNLAHPNILKVLDYKLTAKEAYIVTEYARGGSLKQKIHPSGNELPPNRLPLAQTLHYLSQICAALELVHKKNIVHRDLKPANILFDEQDRPKLADFSLSLKLDTKLKKNLQTAEAWGTAEYAAPEVWQDEVGKPSDIYALGAIVYEMLTGYPPFRGAVEQLKSQHLDAPPPSLAQAYADGRFSPDLDGFLQKALSKDYSERPYSPKVFYIVLKTISQPNFKFPEYPPPAFTKSRDFTELNNAHFVPTLVIGSICLVSLIVLLLIPIFIWGGPFALSFPFVLLFSFLLIALIIRGSMKLYQRDKWLVETYLRGIRFPECKVEHAQNGKHWEVWAVTYQNGIRLRFQIESFVDSEFTRKYQHKTVKVIAHPKNYERYLIDARRSPQDTADLYI